MRGLLAIALVAALPGCNDAARCTANADCPVQSYCVLADGGAQGTCRHDCQATADCGDPALRCTSLGQCVPVVIPTFDAGVDAGVDDVGVDGAPTDAPEAGLDDASATD